MRVCACVCVCVHACVRSHVCAAVYSTTTRHGRGYEPIIRKNFFKDGRFDMPELAARWLGDFVTTSGKLVENVSLKHRIKLSYLLCD